MESAERPGERIRRRKSKTVNTNMTQENQSAPADSLQPVGMGRPQDVPLEIAVCPECGGPLKVWRPDDVWCYCPASTHSPEQTAEMIAKWNEVEAKVAAWLKAKSHTDKVSDGGPLTHK